MKQGLPDAKRHFPFSNYLFLDPNLKFKNILDLPKLGTVMAFLAAPYLWLVPIILCIPHLQPRKNLKK